MTSLFFQYAEVIPILILGLGTFKVVAMLRDHGSWSQKDSRYLGSLAVTIILSIPAGQFFMNFLSQQMHYAASSPNEWYKAYFMWLYSNPLSRSLGLFNLSRKNSRDSINAFGFITDINTLRFNIFFPLFKTKIQERIQLGSLNGCSITFSVFLSLYA